MTKDRNFCVITDDATFEVSGNHLETTAGTTVVYDASSKPVLIVPNGRCKAAYAVKDVDLQKK